MKYENLNDLFVTVNHWVGSDEFRHYNELIWLLKALGCINKDFILEQSANHEDWVGDDEDEHAYNNYKL